jgi:hypothetical protein
MQAKIKIAVTAAAIGISIDPRSVVMRVGSPWS